MENILYTGKKLTARTRMEPARWTLDRETHRTPSIYLRLLDSINTEGGMGVSVNSVNC